jgi:hypothetical protein
MLSLNDLIRARIAEVERARERQMFAFEAVLEELRALLATLEAQEAPPDA